MEQRDLESNPLRLDAVVACTRFGLIRGNITRIDSNGLYIEARTSIVPIDAEVSVTFQPRQSLSDACVSLQGVVSHQNPCGFGITFTDVPAACRKALDALLSTHRSVTEAATEQGWPLAG
ncbi:MAG: hypothetical protein KDI88_11375 [Gammaproteobacteria bacterium]|nr:hypothetical protein [Gammaproteobacteria bacterium]